MLSIMMLSVFSYALRLLRLRQIRPKILPCYDFVAVLWRHVGTIAHWLQSAVSNK
jgi:hypothetical protein